MGPGKMGTGYRKVLSSPRVEPKLGGWTYTFEFFGDLNETQLEHSFEEPGPSAHYVVGDS